MSGYCDKCGSQDVEILTGRGGIVRGWACRDCGAVGNGRPPDAPRNRRDRPRRWDTPAAPRHAP